MPIRFRCVYCDKLLGIARRKAGAVVNCPQCQQPRIVPTPEPEPEATASGEPNKLFERDDIEEMFDPNPDQTYRGPAEMPVPAPVRTAAPPASFPSVPQQRATTVSPKAAATGLVLTTGKLIVLGVVVLALVGGAFLGGYLIGKG